MKFYLSCGPDLSNLFPPGTKKSEWSPHPPEEPEGGEFPGLNYFTQGVAGLDKIPYHYYLD